jgi:hypothetical protein
MVHIYIENRRYYRQIEYVFNTIFLSVGIKCIYIQDLSGIWDNEDDAVIIYAGSDPEQLEILYSIRNLIYIKASGKLFGDDYLKPPSIPLRAIRYMSDNKEDADIISIYNDGRELYITREKNKITTNTRHPYK